MLNNTANAGMVLAGLGAILGIVLVISLIPAVVAFMALNKIPPQHQKQNPVLAFLLVIPLFGIVWAFFLHPKVAESLASWAAAKGDTSHGDCGAKLALWACILPIASIIPILGMLAGIGALVVFIMFYVKAFDICTKLAAKP